MILFLLSESSIGRSISIPAEDLKLFMFVMLNVCLQQGFFVKTGQYA